MQGDKTTVQGDMTITYHAHDSSITITSGSTVITQTFNELVALGASFRNDADATKPVSYLFWLDCINGKSNEWDLIN